MKEQFGVVFKSRKRPLYVVRGRMAMFFTLLVIITICSCYHRSQAHAVMVSGYALFVAWVFIMFSSGSNKALNGFTFDFDHKEIEFQSKNVKLYSLKFEEIKMVMYNQSPKPDKPQEKIEFICKGGKTFFYLQHKMEHDRLAQALNNAGITFIPRGQLLI